MKASLFYDDFIVNHKIAKSECYQEVAPRSTTVCLRRRAASAILFLLLAGPDLGTVQAEEDGADLSSGLILLQPDDPEYIDLADPGVPPRNPEAALRFLVIRKGRLLRDYGLRDTWTKQPEAKNTRNRTAFKEPAIMESVEISLDLHSGVLVRLWIDAVEKDGLLSGNAVLIWIEPDHPEGKWTLALPPDRFVQQVHVLDRSQGVAIMTATPQSTGADFTLYDRLGATVYHLDELAGTVLDFRMTRAGAFLGVEIAYPQQDGLPDRGIVILDRLQNGTWTYTWSYGDTGEPVGWTLRDDGILEIRSPGSVTAFDRTGQAIIPQNSRRRQSRRSRNP